MWIAIYLVVGLVGVVVLMALVGLALPRAHLAARKATLAKPPSEVWSAISEVSAYPSWRRGVKKIEQLSPGSFREHSGDGAITYAIDVDEPPSRRVTRIADDSLPFGGRWIYELAPDGGGTRIKITEDGFVKNPVFRFIRKTVMSEAGTLEKFLVDLGARVGSPTKPEPAEPTKL